MRYVQLTKEERQQLKSLVKTSKNNTIRNRSNCLLLSNEGNSMREISRITGIRWLTIVRLFNAWEQAPAPKFTTLSIAPGRGPKIKLTGVKDKLPSMLEKCNNDLDAVICDLESDHGVKVCKATLRKFIKKSI